MKLELEYDIAEETDPLDRFLIAGFDSTVETAFGTGSLSSVTVRTPSVEAFPSGLLILMLTVDALSLDDKCPLLVDA